MTVLSPLDEVIRDFATAQHLPRIKKLLVYACTQHWESDPDQLTKFNLHDLIATLVQLAPTLEQLSTYLNQVTQTLSKPAEYLLIANTIVQHLRKLYVGLAALPNLNANPHIYWQIAQTLDHDLDHFRIRKLLVLVCRNYWEFDRDRLMTISLPDLLAELHHLTQTFDNLTAVINSVVQTTSKPVQYEAIANRIIKACQSLYLPQQADAMEFLLPTNTVASSPTHATTITPPSLTLSEASHHGHSKNYPQSEPITTEAISDKALEPLDIQPIPAFSKAELYDLRLEIMKYTVPLLSKHLLFLVVYAPPGQASEQEQAEFADSLDAWMSLKNRDLDDLIEAALKQCQTLQNLSTALQLTAQSVKSSQLYIPVVGAVVRATKTLMVRHQSSFQRSEATRQQKQEEREQHRCKEDERTCQVFSSTMTFHEESEALHPPLHQASQIHDKGKDAIPAETALLQTPNPSSQTPHPSPQNQQPEHWRSLSPGESPTSVNPLLYPSDTTTTSQPPPLPEPPPGSSSSTEATRSSKSDETVLLT